MTKYYTFNESSKLNEYIMHNMHKSYRFKCFITMFVNFFSKLLWELEILTEALILNPSLLPNEVNECISNTCLQNLSNSSLQETLHELFDTVKYLP